MTLISKNKKIRRLIAGILAVSVLGFTYVLYQYGTNSKKDIEINSSNADIDPVKVSDNDIDNAPTAPTLNNGNSNTQNTHTPESSDDRSNPTPVGPITASFSSSQEPNGDLIIKATVTGLGVGRCYLSIYDYDGAHQYAGGPIKRTANLLFKSNYSTCEDFVIPASEFNRSGQWQGDLKIKNADDVQVAAYTHSVIVNK